uniref:Uncharacterized protein n=1 Tax=Oryzias melastigma TaxID=30732 RepID=A0A3B3CUJ9_ORYME
MCNSWLKAFLHISQEKGFSPVLNDFPQISQEKGLSPVCVLMCTVKLWPWLKLFPHFSQEKGFSPVCVLMCMTKVLSKQDRVHFLHLLSSFSTSTWIISAILPCNVCFSRKWTEIHLTAGASGESTLRTQMDARFFWPFQHQSQSASQRGCLESHEPLRTHETPQ